MVYSVPEESFETLLGLIQTNMAPWLTKNIIHEKSQMHETKLTLTGGLEEVEIPITQIVEVGRLE